MRLRFKCLFFLWILLVQFPKSQDSCCSSSWWFVSTFVVAIVVSARACISKPLGYSLSCHLANVWLSDIKKKIQKSFILSNNDLFTMALITILIINTKDY